MIIFNFDKIEDNKGFVLVQKDKKTYLEMRGGLTPIKIVLTLVVFKFLSFFHKGYKPFRYQGDANKIKEKGYYDSYLDEFNASEIYQQRRDLYRRLEHGNETS